MDTKKITFPLQFFVTGTDTNVGKTVISALLTLGLKGTYWKPIQCGLEGSSDKEWIRSHTGLNESHFLNEIYVFQNPLSPNQASKLENITLDLNNISLPNQKSLIVEGAGGLMVPLNEHETQLDLIQQLGIPVIIVARSTLGTLNHTLLTIDALRNRKIPIFGIILNGPINQPNKETIEQFGKVKVIAQIEPFTTITSNILETKFKELFY